MEEFRQSREDLERHLQEQVTFLERSVHIYDEGNPEEAKRLATTIRVLIHDTSRSKSLLRQLSLKSIGFVDGGDIPLKGNLAPESTLTVLHYREGDAWWEPKYLVDDRPPPHLRKIESWWTRPVIIDDEKAHISRAQLVLAMVHKDGGGHVDPKLERTYARLTRYNSLKWHVQNHGQISPVLGVEFACVRQIAWEMLNTLERRSRAPRRNLPHFMSLNDPCPCGSGKPYVQCHGSS